MLRAVDTHVAVTLCRDSAREIPTSQELGAIVGCVFFVYPFTWIFIGFAPVPCPQLTLPSPSLRRSCPD